MLNSTTDVTALLQAMRDGDGSALDRLIPLLYDELHAAARRQRQRWRGDDTLNSTALVHEAYLKLVDPGVASWETRAHFLATAALAMRHVLINHARARQAQKRGGQRLRISLDELNNRLLDDDTVGEHDADVLVALDAALQRLARTNERQSRIVECRVFAGMTLEETAAALGLSTATVSRGWALGQARLYEEVRRQLESDEAG